MDRSLGARWCPGPSSLLSVRCDSTRKTRGEAILNVLLKLIFSSFQKYCVAVIENAFDKQNKE